MAKYDWDRLKREFIISKAKTLKQFAIDKNIPYGRLRDMARGWVEEKKTKSRQKQDRITDGILDTQVQKEVDCNTKHYEIYEKLLQSINTYLTDVKLMVPKTIKDLADAMKTIQQGQRLASGLDKENKGGGENVIKDFMEAVISKRNDTNASG